MRKILTATYYKIKSFEYKTPSLFGALIVLTIMLVLIMTNIVKVQSDSGERSPTGTIESTAP